MYICPFRLQRCTKRKVWKREVKKPALMLSCTWVTSQMAGVALIKASGLKRTVDAVCTKERKRKNILKTCSLHYAWIKVRQMYWHRTAFAKTQTASSTSVHRFFKCKATKWNVPLKTVQWNYIGMQKFRCLFFQI